MRTEASSADSYRTPYGKHPGLQILTIKQLLEGVRIDYPPQYAREDKTFRKAPKAYPRREQPMLRELRVAEAESESPKTAKTGKTVKDDG